jgi:hypothetical protein
MNGNSIEVFLGHRLVDPNERRFLRRICHDLEHAGLEAIILANVVAGKPSLQLDFVIAVAQRVVHCELKAWRHRVTGRPNGEWEFHLPDGTSRPAGGNPSRQVTAGTYALSDEMHAFARSGGASPAAGRFFRHVDSVVCMYPDVPPGSMIKTPRFVSVLGYDELIDLLREPGRGGPWSLDDWRAFAAHLGIEAFDERSEHERRLRSRVGDYTRRFESSARQGLAPRVATAVRVDGAPASSFDLVAEVADGAAVTLTGGSGAGKSHLARHASIETARSGHVPIWLQAGAYDGDLEPMLAAACAPLTIEAPRELLAAAAELGCVVAIIVDGLNECPARLRPGLLGEVAALQLQTGAAVIVTSQQRPDLPEALTGQIVELVPPGTEEKEQILGAYGAESAARYTDAFVTPFELSLAAACAGELQGLTTRAALLDAYVDRVAGSEQVRAALRQVAVRMYDELRSSLPLREVLTVLQRDAGVAPAVVDAALVCSLTEVRHGRIAFVHEGFARFLAAEAVVVAGDVVDVLPEPRYADLRADAVALEPDLDRVAELLACLDDEALLFAAATGELGRQRERVTEAILNDLLDEAVVVTRGAEVQDGGFGARWSTERSWSAPERAQLAVVGRLLHRGRFVERVFALLEVTDEVTAGAIDRLRAEGARAPISDVTGGAYAFQVGDGSHDLPASIVVRAATHHGWIRAEAPSAAASRIPGTPANWRWGTLFLALALVRPDDPVDARLVAPLLRRSWDQGSYHLRLDALQLVERAADVLRDEVREAVVAMLEGLASTDVGTGTALVEALAAYDLITPAHDFADIAANIQDVLAEPSRADAAERARSIVVSQLEDERVLGPYTEAIASLDARDRAMLLALATAATPNDDWFADWLVRQLVDEGDLGDAGTQATLIRFASTPDPDRWTSPYTSASACLDAARGCAQFAETPPFEVASASVARALGLVAELAFWHAREELGAPVDDARTADVWAELAGPLRASAVAAFHYARLADSFPTEAPIHDPLVTWNPGVIRDIFEWSLLHRDRIDHSRGLGGAAEYIVGVLETVGNAETATLLRSYANDPALGKPAAAAIRAIDVRCTP